MVAVKLVGPKPASLMATTEPLASTDVGILWLGIPFSGLDWLACGCIIASMVLVMLFPGGWEVKADPGIALFLPYCYSIISEDVITSLNNL